MNPRDTKNLDREGGENIDAILREICDMQAANYGNGVATHMALIDLTERARAALAAQPQAGAAVPSVAGAAGAGEVKTWQERVPGAEYDALSAGECLQLAKAEIADLRAQLARLQAPAGEPVARITFAHEVDGPWRLELNGVTISRHGNRADLDEAVKDLRAALTTPPSAQQEQGDAVRDSELLDFIEAECVTVECVSLPTPGGDDADVGFRIINYHMAEPKEREIGFANNPRDALRDAIRALRATNTEGKEQP